MSDNAKDEALLTVVELMRRHGLTVKDIAALLHDPATAETKQTSSVLSRVFGYVGGIFIFLGLVIYVGMRWETLDAAGRIVVTLGIGFSAFLGAVISHFDKRLARITTPLFLLAALLQPLGIVVLLQEFSTGGNPKHGLLFMHTAMWLQQGLALIALQRTVLAFTALAFGLGFYSVGFELLAADPQQVAMVLGLSLLCIGWSINRSRHQVLDLFGFCPGALLALAAAYDWLNNTSVEILFLGMTCLVIFLSTLARSTSLLVVGTLAMIGYIGNFMNEHFADDLNAPLLLVLMGFILIAIGTLAVRINNKYIKAAV